MSKQTAVFGAGCFWGVELEFSKIPGVISTEVGYMGGLEEKKTYSYGEVCTGETRHAEVVKVVFDSDKISYSNLIDVFWKIHNPTTFNRQGLDVGSQYRSVIFYFDESQKREAENSLKKEEKKIEKKIVTQIVPAGEFYKAEEYHQKYLEKQVRESCRI
ncbi:peptide-methionine (S)-S-oxide reductase [Candidatus Pacearchaeota archaeon CG10_big_fil_rev_8_21_14_0_10_31_24]|nr:MAG: peptide-methionine (S)-S-oxide reductase [Candidatus Pacearchaeota archaeon CG10_big_fil_rev_8_21_14_0_10_31_24]